MIASFNLKSDAEQIADDIHLFLQNKCIGYSAIRWSDITENEDSTFSVPLPQEYDTNLYKVKGKSVKTTITSLLSVSVLKATDLAVKPKPVKVKGWIEKNEYFEGDLVIFKKIKYECIKDHISSDKLNPITSPKMWEEPKSDKK